MWNKSERNRIPATKNGSVLQWTFKCGKCSNKAWMKIRLYAAELCRWRILLLAKPVCRMWLWLWGVPWGAWAASGNHEQYLPNAAPSLSAALYRLANVMSDEKKGKSERAVQPLNLSVETSFGKAGRTLLKVLIIHLEIVQPDSSAFQVCACSSNFRKVGKVLLTRYHNTWKLQVYLSVF